MATISDFINENENVMIRIDQVEDLNDTSYKSYDSTIYEGLLYDTPEELYSREVIKEGFMLGAQMNLLTIYKKDVAEDETLEEVLIYYKKDFPSDFKLTINYTDADDNTLFTLKDITATELLESRKDNMYLECKVFGYLEHEIKVYYHYPAVIL